MSSDDNLSSDNSSDDQTVSSQLTRKYGLVTAIAMVVGCVVGSGIFFKTGQVLAHTGGSVWIGVLAWIVGGLIMIVCTSAFSTLAKRYEKVSGFTDYTEALIGKKFGYFTGWFMATVYGPATVALISWVAADYTRILFDIEPNTTFVFALTAMYMALIFGMTVFGPKISGKFQVSTTFIKAIPLILIGIVGVIFGIINDNSMTRVATAVATSNDTSVAFFAAILTTSFAYSGWDAVTSINSEIKDSKRNLPIALMAGGVIIVLVYILYFLGISSAGQNDALMDDPNGGTYVAVDAIFNSSVVSSILLVFIIISCLGAVNGHTMSTNRQLYSIASRGMGPNPKLFDQVDKQTNTPINAAVFSFVIAFVWLFVHMFSENSWFGEFYIDIGDITTLGFFIICIPLFLSFMIKEKDLHAAKRFALPGLAFLGSLFLVISPAIDNIWLIVTYALIIAFATTIGALFLIKRKNYE